MARKWEKSLERVGELAIQIILSKVGSKETAYLSCCGRVSKQWAEEDDLWLKFLSDELCVNSPVDPLGNPCLSFKTAYKAWREAFRMYPWSLVIRVKIFWDMMELWLSNNFSGALDTLRDGASEHEMNELEMSLGVKLPIPMRVLYRFHDGQDVRSENYPEINGSPLGLIGGYQYYTADINVYLLPLQQLRRETEYIRLAIDDITNFVVVANSSTSCAKPFFLNCDDGQLHVGTRNFLLIGEMMPCVPENLIKLKDGILLWLEEHLNRLLSGEIKTRSKDNYSRISLFPEKEPLCSTLTTQGIQVRASAVLVPEFTDLGDNTHKYYFTYSIRMSLDSKSERLFYSCQLSRRHWTIGAGDYVLTVDGLGVLREYPVLSPEHSLFLYQSNATTPSSTGTMEGFFTFVPGRLEHATGDPFQVNVAEFPLLLPGYIF